jgi:hypothetical protein
MSTGCEIRESIAPRDRFVSDPPCWDSAVSPIIGSAVEDFRDLHRAMLSD